MSLNWNVIYAHNWVLNMNELDRLYDLTINYINRDNVEFNDNKKRTIRNRVSYGYRIHPTRNDTLVIYHKGVLPWDANKTNNTAILYNPMIHEEHMFTVVRPSKRDDEIRELFKDTSTTRLNSKTILDALHRKFLLGISREYIQHVLENDVQFDFFRNAKLNPKKPIVKSFRPSHPFEHWQMDYTSLFTPGKDKQVHPKRENKYYIHILVIIDIFSKFVYLFPTKNESAETTAMILNKIFLTGDIPKILHSDNAKNFLSEAVRKVCDTFNVTQVFGEGYSPQTQGFVENKNKYIKKLIQQHWIRNDSFKFYDVIDRICFSINTSKHDVTKYTPMQIHRGRNINTVKTEYFNGNIDDVLQIDCKDVENYVESETIHRKHRIQHVKDTLKHVAHKREERQRKQQTQGVYIYQGNLEMNTKVVVAVYIEHTSKDIQAMQLKLVDSIQGTTKRVNNPLHIKSNDRYIRVTDIDKRASTFFKKSELSKHKYFSKMICKIKEIKKTGTGANVVKYLLEYKDPQTNTTYDVFRRVASDMIWTNEFHKTMLLTKSQYAHDFIPNNDNLPNVPEYLFDVDPFPDDGPPIVYDYSTKVTNSMEQTDNAEASINRSLHPTYIHLEIKHKWIHTIQTYKKLWNNQKVSFCANIDNRISQLEGVVFRKDTQKIIDGVPTIWAVRGKYGERWCSLLPVNYTNKLSFDGAWMFMDEKTLLTKIDRSKLPYKAVSSNIDDLKNN